MFKRPTVWGATWVAQGRFCSWRCLGVHTGAHIHARAAEVELRGAAVAYGFVYININQGAFRHVPDGPVGNGQGSESQDHGFKSRRRFLKKKNR